MALTTTDYVRPGATWPPRSEQVRITRMNRYRAYYNGDYRQLNPNDEFRVTRNMFRMVANFWRDTLTGDPPRIAVNERADDFIGLLRPTLISSARAVTRDVARYGCGVFYARVPGRIETVDPRFWFPVVNPADISDVRAHVIAYPFTSNPETPQVPDRLQVYVLEGGVCSERVYGLTGGSLQAQVGDEVRTPCAPDPIAWVFTDDDDPLYGVSFFTDLEPLVRDLHRRESLLSTALDNHSNPHLAVPEGAFKANANGSVTVATNGVVIPVPDGARAPEYVTWDPKFAEHRDSISRSLEAVFQMTGISRILFDPSQASGAIPSGAALRRLALPTVQRIRVFRDALGRGIREVLAAAGVLNGAAGGELFAFDPDDVVLSWPSALSTGFGDDADAAVALVGAGILDTTTAQRVLELENA